MIETIRKTIQKRSTAAMAVFLLLCLLTAGCGGQSSKQAGEDQPGGAQQQAGQEKTRGHVRIGVLQIADSFPLYVAVEERLF